MLHYIPIDVSATFLEESAQVLVGRFPTLRVTGYVADYQTALPVAAAQIGGPKFVVFLGSSLGNYSPEEAVALRAGQPVMHPKTASCSGPTWPRTGPPWRPPTMMRKA